MTEFDFYPNTTMSEEEREAHLRELYPVYVRPDRPDRVKPVQHAEPEPQLESPAVIEAPPVTAGESVIPDVKRKWNPALASVFALASEPLSGQK
jgi:hypothetical protein